ncbi:hypothetical protein [Nocardioides pocheonensis]|uniref:Uncharacterized protein n=1 Tax=Nocardioides pocheonensis TaxID=661485 RepID=A0A3N0GII3_9ACTN|nr:hypothetical protein [Nocardioides pocheonensis]RNM12284.1 hypothetical protein EFL26_19570 [Nocardioides pocheonensis]
MAVAKTAQEEFLALSDVLKRCRGQEFEEHSHPAVLLDRATSPSVRVWGWWASSERKLPCLLWCSERGWFATVVEPDEIGAPGYELAFWSHRVRLLDLAFANALGPHPTLGVLELHVAADSTVVLGPYGSAVREALLWGILQLRAARRGSRRRKMVASSDQAASLEGASRVDEELAQHALVPWLVKRRSPSEVRPTSKDPAVDALVRALSEVRLTGKLTSFE